ncbi:hypothetical protein RJ640_026995 [Escallonia rubra]|uniref:Uncharacterized protein n=1 Tax=Escallonia rubra TaxID=112253 RepID=A0AA88RKH5_9ASTE|nr:hypothetical protein RJ640_026995 [Escallonia rubra]
MIFAWGGEETNVQVTSSDHKKSFLDLGMLEFLIEWWRLEKLEGLTGESKRAQDFVCGLAPRIRKL